MNKLSVLLFLMFFVLILTLLAPSASAVVLDFEDFAPRTFIMLGPSIGPDYGIYEGFQFGCTSSPISAGCGGSTDRVDVLHSDYYSLGPAWSGKYVLLNNVGGAGYITAEDGGLFSFQSVYAKFLTQPPYYYERSEIKGFLGGIEVASLTFKLTDSWQQVTGNFSNIDRLEFNLGGLFLLDDIVLNEPASVPESSTMLLLGSGLIGLIGFGRKFTN